MTARDIINAACAKVNKSHDHTYATAVLAALSAAGYRILAPGELDGETLERAAEVAENMPTMVPTSPAHVRGLKGSDVASDIRALRESGG